MRDLGLDRPEGVEPSSRSGNRRRAKRLALVASSTLQSLKTFPFIVNELRGLPSGATLLLRRPRTGSAGFVEEVTAKMTNSEFLPLILVEWYSPDPGGRDQTYRRDYELVETADEVLALFDPARVMEGGTGHVVESALLRRIPVRAYVVHEDGQIERVGEADHV